MTETPDSSCRELQMRIARALELADLYGDTDGGGHHRKWVIDQMVRTLCGCPVVMTPMLSADGEEYELKSLGENDQYRAFVEEYEGEEGEYEWELGTPPWKKEAPETPKYSTVDFLQEIEAARKLALENNDAVGAVSATMAKVQLLGIIS
jgi:hypothetical protein